MKLQLGGIVLLFFPFALLAQTATLRGVVTDDSGAIVPGAKITLTANTGTANTAVAGNDRSYSFTGITLGVSFTMEMENILNHTNPGPMIGNITSPLFGRANQPAGGGGFAGFSEAANNCRLELQTRFTF